MYDTIRYSTNNNRCCRFVAALLVLLTSGISGLLLDVDHILVLWIRGLPVTLENLAFNAGRPLHVPTMLVSGLVFFICYALLVRRIIVDAHFHNR